ncbi:E3 ubiquitin-protein ligase RNF25 isoform X3 [Emydura macquarii macquarii]|uniref:E3 ubiquitin-protein ligase RNF25 isoform X3 n=1 Tax=Emydura macquarii macquarii TaxID=1129001 RepID=UPI003529DB27
MSRSRKREGDSHRQQHSSWPVCDLSLWLPGERSFHKDSVLPLLPLSLPGSLRPAHGEGNPCAAERERAAAGATSQAGSRGAVPRLPGNAGLQPLHSAGSATPAARSGKKRLAGILPTGWEQYRPDAKTLQNQEELRRIYQRQQEKGGIIDPEAERNRYFISLQAPPAAAEPAHGAAAELLPSANAVAAAERLCQPPDPEHAPETAGSARALAPGREPGQREKASVPLEHQSKRERHQGERLGPRGQGRPYSDPPAAAADAHPLLRGAGGPSGFSWRPERREGRSQRTSGRCSQEFPKPPGRGRVAALADRKESCPEGILPTKGALDSKEENPGEGRWMPEQGAEGRSREKENLALNHSDPRGPTSWQGYHRTWDCGRWEKSRGRERGSYPRVPRGRGAFRPSGRRDPHGQVKEDGS